MTNVFADAWSAPGFMKTNNSVDNGGQVCGVTGTSCGSGDWRQAYANYLVQYARDYANAGVPLTYIGPSNEPDFSASYDSMTMSPAQMANLLDVVGPAVLNSGLTTHVECCAATGWPVAGQYATAIESNPTALADTAVLTGHGYSGEPTSPLPGWTKPAWESEWYGTDNPWDANWDDGTADSGFTWAQRIYQGLTGANLSAYLFWWGTSTGNESLIDLQGNSVSASSRLWAYGNYSRFVRPGAVRIGASSSSGAVDLSAFKNTDGTVAIVALNTASGADPITYSLSGTGIANGATVTPYLTNSSASIAAQGRHHRQQRLVHRHHPGPLPGHLPGGLLGQHRRRRVPVRLSPAGGGQRCPVPGFLREHLQRRGGHRPVDLQRPDRPGAAVRRDLGRLRRAAGARTRART